MKRVSLIQCATVALVFAAEVSASVTETINKPQWQSGVGAYTTITFGEYPVGTLITNQYASQGVVFTEGNDFISDIGPLPGQVFGLDSNEPFGQAGSITMQFSSPQNWIGVDFVGIVQFELYSQGQLVFTSGLHHYGFGPFLGLISTTTFDEVRVYDPTDAVVAIDNLYFGPPVPAPGALSLIAVAGISGYRKRKW
jgi:hypothetical protein